MFNNILPFMEANRSLFTQQNNEQVNPTAQIALWKLGQILAQNSIMQTSVNAPSPFQSVAMDFGLSQFENKTMSPRDNVPKLHDKTPSDEEEIYSKQPNVNFQEIFRSNLNNILAQLAQNSVQSNNNNNNNNSNVNLSNLKMNILNQTQENSSHESGIFSNATSTPPPVEELHYSTSSSSGSPPHESSDTSGNSFSTPQTNRSSKKSGFQAGITVGYTYDAFFVSDGRSKRRKSNSSTNKSTDDQNSFPPASIVQPINVTSSNGNNSSSENSLIMNICSEQNEAKRNQRYSCSECGKHYATSSNLSRHKQTHRSLDSKMAKKCPHCGKAYVSMPALSMHILTHDLRHRCDICGKAFSRPWLLQGHRRAHTGEKPYGCAHCGRAFADRSNLRAHMQIHSQMKQFQCTNCEKGFVLKSYLNKHMETCNGPDGMNVSLCSPTDELPTQVPSLTLTNHLPFSLASLVDDN